MKSAVNSLPNRVLAVALCCVCVQAQRTVFALVTANELNVREQPNASAAMIGKVDRNTVVEITQAQGSWARIRWWTPEDASSALEPARGFGFKSGWVVSKYLRVVRESLSGGSEYTTSYGARFTLSIDDKDLHCSEDFDGGLRSCELTVRYSYDSNYNGNNEPSVDVACEADLRTTNSEGWPESKSERGTDSVFGRTGYGTIDLDFLFFSSFDPVVRARVSNLECEITSVN